MTKKEEMFKLIQSWEHSGLSQKGFCNKNDIAISTFGYWRKLYLKSQKPKSGVKAFKQIKFSPNPERNYKITYPNGVSISLSSEVDKNELAKLIRCLD